jgi:hypothetical protein
MPEFLNLPSKEQFDVQNTLLASIASHVGTEGIKVTNWEDVQRVVRMGLADKMFKVGDQFIAKYNNNPFIWDVIGINHDIPTDKKFTKSLTIQAHDCLMNCQFDAPEALYYAEVELLAGEHVFTLNSLKYTFTTTLAVPVGGQVVISTWQGTTGVDEFTPTNVATYGADRKTAIESNLVVSGASGADTLTPVNVHHRCRYGSNNYAASAIKQWLNSEAVAFAWTPKTNFDRPPVDAPFTGGGFLKLLDADLLAVLGAVDKQVAKNTVTDGGGQDLFSDKVFLLSTKEVYGANEGTITGENPYPWYSALASNPTNDPLVGRIKYLTGSARNWWLRSPHVTNSHYPRLVGTTGGVNSYGSAYGAFGLAPACCIV